MILATISSICVPVSGAAADQQSKSGYEDVSDFGGEPSDIANELEADDRTKDSLLGPLPDHARPGRWFDAKEYLNRKAGIQFGISWASLYHRATESLGTEDQAAAGRLHVEGTWTVLGRGTKDRGIVGFRLQHRHRLGTDLSPAFLGPEIGSLWTTGFGFNDFGFAVTDLWWQQCVVEGRFCFRLGKFFRVFDPFSFKSPLFGFQNAAFTGTPALGFPFFALGAAARVRLSKDVDLVVGLSDANGEPTTSGFDTFFDDHEYAVAGELRWKPKLPSGIGKFHLTMWHVDAREQAETPEGWGGILSGEYEIGGVTPFLRYQQQQKTSRCRRPMLSDFLRVGATSRSLICPHHRVQ